MGWILTFAVSFILSNWIGYLFENRPESGEVDLSMTGFCQKYSYFLYNETVITDDKYILTLHRIPCQKSEKNCTNRRPPVLLMHGLTGSSVDFVAAKNQSLAFQLADKGFDVWLGNARGNTYSRRHVTLDPNKDSAFWNFSFHEIGTLDIPAMVDHIIARTNFSKITYVGMSQGSTSYFVMASLRPEYNDKILLANAIAPVTTLFNTRNILFRMLAAVNFVIEPILNLTGPLELFGNESLETHILRHVCRSSHKVLNYICTEYLIKYIIGSSEQLNYDLIPFHVSLSPAGVSSKQMLHFVQNKIAGKFCQYDYYGENQAHYGQSIPAMYNLSKITSPLSIYFSKGDAFLNTTLIFKDLRVIPNIVLKYEVPNDAFNHVDFIYAKDLNLLVHDKLIHTIETFNNRK